MKWLITAFEPFAGATQNSSWVLLEHLQRMEFSVKENVHFWAPIPVSFERAWPTLRGYLEQNTFDGVLALGQAERRSRLSLERLALNWVDVNGADNEGLSPRQGPLTHGESTLWSTIPWERLPEGPLWERSYSAGTFVCNALFFELLKWAKDEGKMAGFIHVPLLSSATMNESSAALAMTEILQFLVRL